MEKGLDSAIGASGKPSRERKNETHVKTFQLSEAVYSRWSGRLSHVNRCAIWKAVTIEALVSKRTGSASLKYFSLNSSFNATSSSTHLLVVLAVFFAEGRFVLCDQLILLLGVVHPERAGTHEVAASSTLGTSTDNFVIELFRLPPGSDALEAEAVIAVWQNSKALFAPVFLPHDVEAYAASFLLRSLD